MDRTLTLFANTWIALAILVNLAAIAGTIMTSPSLSARLDQVRSIYSPFNVINCVMEIVLFLPAIIALG